MTNITHKPWGSEELVHQGNGYAVKKITLLKSNRTSLHYHEVKHETIMVHSGSLNLYIDDLSGSQKTLTLSPGETHVIPAKFIHQMLTADVDAVYFEAQTDHLNDVVRLVDHYGRL